MNDTDYFFDSLRQITDWSKKAKRIKDGKKSSYDLRNNDIDGSLYLPVCMFVYSSGGPVNISYHVFFMRKLWFNVIPGRDTQADLIFHFPQVYLNDASQSPSYFPAWLVFPSDMKDTLTKSSVAYRQDKCKSTAHYYL